MSPDVLMFHRVLPKNKYGIRNAYTERGTLISLPFFESIIDKIMNLGREVVTMLEYHELQERQEVTPNHIVLTFDDGYEDNYNYVLPILEKYQVKATFYPTLKYCFEGITSPLDDYYSIGDQLKLSKDARQNWIVGEQKKYFLSLGCEEQQKYNVILADKYQKSPLNKIKYMSQTQLQELVQLGHEIGGHSYHHPILSKMSDKELQRELEQTRNCLDLLGVPKKRTFAYPDGAYNDKVISYIRNGYCCACTVEDKMRNGYQAFNINRCFVYGGRVMTEIL